MTPTEAEVVLRIMERADGYCKYCWAELMRGFVAEFGFRDLAQRLWNEAGHENEFLDG